MFFDEQVKELIDNTIINSSEDVSEFKTKFIKLFNNATLTPKYRHKSLTTLNENLVKSNAKVNKKLHLQLHLLNCGIEAVKHLNK